MRGAVRGGYFYPVPTDISPSDYWGFVIPYCIALFLGAVLQVFSPPYLGWMASVGVIFGIRTQIVRYRIVDWGTVAYTAVRGMSFRDVVDSHHENTKHPYMRGPLHGVLFTLLGCSFCGILLNTKFVYVWFVILLYWMIHTFASRLREYRPAKCENSAF